MGVAARGRTEKKGDRNAALETRDGSNRGVFRRGGRGEGRPIRQGRSGRGLVCETFFVHLSPSLSLRPRAHFCAQVLVPPLQIPVRGRIPGMAPAVVPTLLFTHTRSTGALHLQLPAGGALPRTGEGGHPVHHARPGAALSLPTPAPASGLVGRLASGSCLGVAEP